MKRIFGSAATASLAAALLTAIGQAAAQSQPAKPTKISVIPIDPAASNVLMASDADLDGSLKEQWPGQAARFWIWGWTSNADSFTWAVHVAKTDDYHVSLIAVNCGKVLIDCKLQSPAAVPIEVSNESGTVDFAIPYRKASMTNEWMRYELPGTLHLAAGDSRITMRARAPAGEVFDLALYSLELTTPEAKKALSAQASKLRSSTRWMQDAKYGLMFTWTAATFPQHGPNKPYAEQVRDFDVNRFANMVAGTGAGFVVFATSWSMYYFPGPIASWERLVPGHTTSRDLIGELADALNARGIKLMIYYHAGRADKDFWTSDSIRKTSKDAYFKEWEDQIREIGLRYGDKLAGFWFDDGFTFYYPLQAPWQAMTKAAKAGNPARLVGYNSWIFPKATDFQDFACGEGAFADRLEDNDSELPDSGSGVFIGGPQKGLQATLTTTNEPCNWGNTAQDTPIPAPGLKTDELIAYLQKAEARKLVPVINFEVYEDGTASPQTIEEFKTIKAAIKPSK